MVKADGHRGRNEGWVINSLWVMLYYYAKRNERKFWLGIELESRELDTKYDRGL
jgi:hypothetical protein